MKLRFSENVALALLRLCKITGGQALPVSREHPENVGIDVLAVEQLCLAERAFQLKPEPFRDSATLRITGGAVDLNAIQLPL